MKLTDKEFFSAIKRLKSNKFGGLQLITNDMLKAGQNILAPSLLSYLIVHFFMYFIFWILSGSLVNRLSKPYFQAWRSIKTRELQRHIYIAITGCLGKLLNSILNNRLNDFLLNHKIIL